MLGESSGSIQLECKHNLYAPSCHFFFALIGMLDGGWSRAMPIRFPELRELTARYGKLTYATINPKCMCLCFSELRYHFIPSKAMDEDEHSQERLGCHQ